MLIVNRVRPDMVKRGDMMSVDDVKEILSEEVIGIVPDDEDIVVTTNKGEPAVAEGVSKGRHGLQKHNLKNNGRGSTVFET